MGDSVQAVKWWIHLKTLSIQGYSCHYSVIKIIQVECWEVASALSLFVSSWWNPPLWPPSSIQGLYPLFHSPTAPQGHTHTARYPTLSMDCGWDVFHWMWSCCSHIRMQLREFCGKTKSNQRRISKEVCLKKIPANRVCNTYVFNKKSQTCCSYYHININSLHFLSFGKL